MFALLGLVVWSSAATLTAAYYYTQYNETRGAFEQWKSIVADTSILIDYGNGTANWHNETVIAGSTAFDALLTVTKNVKYDMSANGAYVKSINGLLESVEAQTPTSMTGHSWFFYYWSSTGSNWTKSSKGADQYILKPNDSTAWRFEHYSYSW
jgi:hypothetical protein